MGEEIFDLMYTNPRDEAVTEVKVQNHRKQYTSQTTDNRSQTIDSDDATGGGGAGEVGGDGLSIPYDSFFFTGAGFS